MTDPMAETTGADAGPTPTALAAKAFMERIDHPAHLRTVETCALNGGWVGSREAGSWDTKVSDSISRAAIRAVIDLFRAWAAEVDEPRDLETVAEPAEDDPECE